jgi:hypothetical protein
MSVAIVLLGRRELIQASMRAIGVTRLVTVTLFPRSMSELRLRPILDVKLEGKPAPGGANGMSDRKSNKTRSLRMQYCSDTVT